MPSRVSRRSAASRFATILLAVVAGCSRGAAPSSEDAGGAAAPAGIVLGAVPTAAKKSLTAALIDDLASLPPGPDGVRPLAAGSFGPPGTKFPGGLAVTWPLPEARTPGSRLWIAAVSADGKSWTGTGEQAVVLPSGRAAQGLVFHFSRIGVFNRRVPGALRRVIYDGETPVPRTDAELALARWRIMRWKDGATLMDWRPDEELDALGRNVGDALDAAVEDAATDSSLGLKRRLRHKLYAAATSSLQSAFDEATETHWKALETGIAPAKEGITQTLGWLDGRLTAATETVARVREASDHARAAGKESGANAEARKSAAEIFAKDLAAAEAELADADATKKRLKSWSEGLEWAEKGFDLAEKVTAEREPGYEVGVLKSVFDIVEELTDEFDDAKDSFTEAALEAGRNYRPPPVQPSRLRPARGQAPGLWTRLRAAREKKESEAAEALARAADRKLVLDDVKKMIGHAETAFSVWNDTKKKLEEVEKVNRPVRHLMTEECLGFSRYFAAAAAAMSAAGSASEEIAPPTVVAILKQTGDLFENIARVPAFGYTLQKKLGQGIQFTREEGVLLYPVERLAVFPELGIRAYHVEEFEGPDDVDVDLVVPPLAVREWKTRGVRVNPEQFDAILRAASTYATLAGRQPTQDEFREIADVVANGGRVRCTLWAWDDDGDLGKWNGEDGTEHDLGAEDLLDEFHRAEVDRVVGEALRVHEEISKSIDEDDAKKIALKLLQDATGADGADEGRALYTRHRNRWRELEAKWREAYRSRMTSTFYSVVAADPKSPLLARLDDQVALARSANEAQPAARVFAISAKLGQWDRVDCRMSYEVAPAPRDVEVERFFRVTMPGGDEVEFDPSVEADAWERGAKVDANVAIVPPDRPATVTVRGVLRVGKQEFVSEPRTIEVRPPLEVRHVETEPAPLASGAAAAVIVVLRIDEDLAPGKDPVVRVTIDGPDGKPVEVKVSEQGVRYVDRESAFVVASIDRLPAWKRDAKTKVRVSVEMDDRTASGTADVAVGTGTQARPAAASLPSRPAAPTAASAPAAPPVYVPSGTTVTAHAERDVDVQTTASGAVRIRTFTEFDAGFGRRVTGIEIVSEALTGIDDVSDDRTLTWAVETARSAAGPWTRPQFAPGLPGGTPVEGPGSLAMARRTAKGTARIRAPFAEEVTDAGDPLQPLHFRVAEYWTEGSSSERPGDDEVVVSNVAGPGPGLVLAQEQDENLRRSLQNAANPWVQFAAELTHEAQAFTHPGAHFTVSTGSWTGHFWSPRVEGGRVFQSDDGRTANTVANYAGLRVPFTPDGATATVAADRGAVSGRAEVRLDAYDAEPARAALDAAVADLERKWADARQSWQQEIANLSRDPSRARDAEQKRLWFERSEANHLRDVAWYRRNYAEMVAQSRRLLDISRRDDQFAAESPSLDATRRAEARERAGLGSGLVLAARSQLAGDALLAGDLATIREARLGIVAQHTTALTGQQVTAESRSAAADELFKLANETALLSGDRDSAAAMCLTARRLVGNASNEPVYLSWWPETAPDPASVPTLDQLQAGATAVSGGGSGSGSGASKPAATASVPPRQPPARPPTDRTPPPPPPQKKPPETKEPPREPLDTDDPEEPAAPATSGGDEPPPPPPPARPPRRPEQNPPAQPPRRTAREEADEGTRLLQSGEAAGAAAAFERALTLDPRSREAHAGRAALRDLSGDLPGAIDDLRAAVGPTVKETDAWDLRVRLADALVAARRFDEAESEIAAIERSGARPLDAALLRARAHIARKDMLAAGKALAVAQTLSKEPDAGPLARAETFLRHGQAQRCLDELRLVRVLAPALAEPDRLAGLSFSALGRTEDAIRMLESYLRRQPDGANADEARRKLQELTGGVKR